MSLPPEYICQGDYSRRSARIAAEQLLRLPNPPTAIFAASDDMALEVIALLLEKGRSVPEDCSVIGFDDNPTCLFGPIALTTIHQPLFEMGADAVELVQQLISGKRKAIKKTLLTPTLVLRESCAAPTAA